MITVCNVSYEIGGGKVKRKLRKYQNRSFNWDSSLSNNQILDALYYYGFYPCKGFKIKRK